MTKRLAPDDLRAITSRTVNHYSTRAESFWEGTKDHDVTQNYDALLSELPPAKGLRILDLGCGPGRDLLYFKGLGHEPVGLDGSEVFCEMAAAKSGCKVLNQSFLDLHLDAGSFDGIFANASLFHVPRQELTRVLTDLRHALVLKGVLFSSNPRGNDEGWSGDRYGTYLELDVYRAHLEEAGFSVLQHFYRPKGLPCAEQPWLAVVGRAE